LAKNEVPLLVNATCGTTVLAALDPFDEIADVCEKYGIWLHIDAALGGTVLLSEMKKHMKKGIERADSLTWDPHKHLTVPL
jgi:glutamate/tyrosine decarboxylase-like PLP-dependent enzyme